MSCAEMLSGQSIASCSLPGETREVNSTLIERAQSWLKGDGIPQLLPGLMAPIDADKLADDLRLSAQGADRGERDLPASNEANFDPIELEIGGRVGAEASMQR